MNPVANAVVGLPALIGVVLGLKLYADPVPTAYCVGALIVIAYGARWIAFAIMHRMPRLARWLIELWILSAIGVTALGTAAVTWLTLNASLALLFDTSRLAADQLKTMTAAFVTAVTTYIALVGTKDIGDATGFFWSSGAFKTAMAKAYANLPDAKKPQGPTKEYAAIFLDAVPGFGPIGWGFSARGMRAKIFADCI